MRKNDIIYNIANPDELWRIVRQKMGAWVIEKVGIPSQPQLLLFFEHIKGEWKKQGKEVKTNDI